MKAKICTNDATLKNNVVAYVELYSTDFKDDAPKYLEENVYPYLSFIGQQRVESAYLDFDARTDTVILLNENECSYIFNKKDISKYVNNVKNTMIDLNSNLQETYKKLKDDLLANDRAKYIIDKLSKYNRNDMVNDIKKYYNKFLLNLEASK